MRVTVRVKVKESETLKVREVRAMSGLPRAPIVSKRRERERERERESERERERERERKSQRVKKCESVALTCKVSVTWTFKVTDVSSMPSGSHAQRVVPHKLCALWRGGWRGGDGL